MNPLKLTDKNIPEILELERTSAPDKPYYSKYDVAALKFIFENKSTCKSYGLFEDNGLIGWGCYRTNWKDDNTQKGVYEISSIVIHKNYRRKGLGKNILDAIISDIKMNQDYKKIYLTVYPDNIPPLFLYLKNGFIIYNFKKDVYGPGSDRVYLRLKD